MLLVIPLTLLKAQPSLQSNIWYFGNHAGLDFNSGTPVAVTNGALSTFEGTASIADKNTGQILFYTDGDTIYDATHNMMLNGGGLLGHNSATQSGVIVPDPGNANQYYVFTVGAQAGFLGSYGGIAYSIVDMTLNGGLGAVTIKNVQLVNPASEKITSVRHCNGRDVWVITHQWNSNAFYTYLVTPAGVQPPVISNVGIIHQSVGSTNNSESIGYMKAAPDQQHVGLCTFYPMNIIQLFDFDNVIGVLSNANTITMPVIGTYGGPYGCSFSPDGSKFYAAFHNFSGSPNYVFQYNMNAGTPAAVVGSQTVVASTSAVSYGALQLASDGKMYMGSFSNAIGGSFGSPTIDRFSNPNATGLASGYVANAVFLGGKTSVWGLPDYIQSFFSPPVATNFNDTAICTGASVTFNPTYGIVMDSITWNFDDPLSGTLNYSNLNAPSHTFNDAGIYNVQLIVHYNCHHDTLTRNVTVNDLPVFLGNDTTICIGNNLTLDPNYPGASYLWSNGLTNQNITVSNPGGTYWIELTDGMCIAYDTINVSFNPPPIVTLGNDTTICIGQNLVLNAGNTGSSFLWSTGATTQTIAPLISGNYWVVADLTGCIDKDTILVTVNQPPVIYLGNDTALCIGQVLQLNANALGYTNQWSNGSTNSSINVNTSGPFWVQLDNGICTAVDTINVSFNAPPIVALGNDTTICTGQNLVLNAGNTGSSFLWSTGATTQTIVPLISGNYWVVADLTGCIDKDTILVTVNQPPVIYLGNDTALCIGQVLQLNTNAAGYTNQWSDGSTNSSIIINNSGTFWVQLDNGICTVVDTINVSFNAPPIVALGNDTTICTGQNLVLDAGNTGSSFLWSTGATTQTIVPLISGNYWVVADLTGCIDKDTILVNVNQPPVIYLGNDTALCIGQMLQLNANAAGYTNQWSNGSTNGSIIINNSGTFWVQLANGICTVNDSINVQFNPMPVANLGNDTTVCSNSPVTLDAGNASASFLWSTGATTQTITATTAGSYSVTVNLTGCIDTDTMQLFVDVPPAVLLGNDTTLCQGETLSLNAFALGYANLWSNGSTATAITVTVAGSYSIQLDNGICKVSDSINLLFDMPPVINIGNDTTLCQGQVLQLDAGNPAAIYLWNSGATTQMISVNNAGAYAVIVTKGACSRADSINVNYTQPLLVQLGSDTTLCQGQSVTLQTPLNGYSYLWNTGATTQSIIANTGGMYNLEVFDGLCKSYDSINVNFISYPIVALGNDTAYCLNAPMMIDGGNPGASYLWSTGATTRIIALIAPGFYWVVAAYGNCKATDTIHVDLLFPPAVYLGKDSSLCSGDLVTLDAGNTGSAFLWNDGDTSQIKTITATGIYTITVTNNDGCMDSDSIEFGSLGCQIHLYMPNSFTPNNDGINDYFHAYTDNVISIDMTIFNRWGQEIFYSQEFLPGWDGTFNNTICPEGVYAVLINYSGEDEKGNIIMKSKKGTVRLIR